MEAKLYVWLMVTNFNSVLNIEFRWHDVYYGVMWTSCLHALGFKTQPIFSKATKLEEPLPNITWCIFGTLNTEEKKKQLWAPSKQFPLNWIGPIYACRVCFVYKSVKTSFCKKGKKNYSDLKFLLFTCCVFRANVIILNQQLHEQLCNIHYIKKLWTSSPQHLVSTNS